MISILRITHKNNNNNSNYNSKKKNNNGQSIKPTV